MKALVTGGAGFIGSTLVDRLLAEGHAVDVVDDLSTGSLGNLADARSDRANELRFHHADVRSPEVADLVAHRQPDVVFHLAAAPDAGAARAAEVGVVGLVNVLEGARRGNAAKVVCGATAGGSPLDAAVVAYLAAYRERHDVEFTALALASVYGPRQSRGVISAFLAAAATGEPCRIHGDGRQVRDFVYVDDVVDAFVRAAARGSGLAVDVGTGVQTSVEALCRLVSTLPPVHVAAAGLDGSPPPVDPARAAMYLGWKPWTPLEEGLRLTAAG